MGSNNSKTISVPKGESSNSSPLSRSLLIVVWALRNDNFNSENCIIFLEKFLSSVGNQQAVHLGLDYVGWPFSLENKLQISSPIPRITCDMSVDNIDIHVLATSLIGRLGSASAVPPETSYLAANCFLVVLKEDGLEHECGVTLTEATSLLNQRHEALSSHATFLPLSSNFPRYQRFLILVPSTMNIKQVEHHFDSWMQKTFSTPPSHSTQIEQQLELKVSPYQSSGFQWLLDTPSNLTSDLITKKLTQDPYELARRSECDPILGFSRVPPFESHGSALSDVNLSIW